jgi:hypothetical protein
MRIRRDTYEEGTRRTETIGGVTIVWATGPYTEKARHGGRTYELGTHSVKATNADGRSHTRMRTWRGDHAWAYAEDAYITIRSAAYREAWDKEWESRNA